MIATRSRLRGAVFTRKALATALALGLASGAMGASSAMAAAPAYSKEFVAVAGPIQQGIEKAKKSPDAATLADLKKQFDAAAAAAKTPDDKFAVGNFGIQIGGLTQDQTYQRKGVALMLESGKASPDLLPRLHFYAGNFAYEAKDFLAARTELQAAITAGYPDIEAQVLLAETYFLQKQDKEGLPILLKAIDAGSAGGKLAPESWYRRALGAAYTTTDYQSAVTTANKLVRAYPTKQNWSAAIAVLRDLGKLPSQDTIDLMRLMDRTDSFAEERDYAEFVQNADARRNPGEVKAVIERGVAAKQVDATKVFFAENLRIASGRVAADRASLPGLEKDARAPSASAIAVAGAGDAFLSYHEGAKAAELYKLALTKAGVDKPVVYTRLGIALVDAGDYAGAKAAFAQVEGVRQGMAMLWATYADEKAGAK